MSSRKRHTQDEIYKNTDRPKLHTIHIRREKEKERERYTERERERERETDRQTDRHIERKLSNIQQHPYVRQNINPFSAGTTFMLMQTGWIQASRRTRRLA